jgi:hypothetical protein
MNARRFLSLVLVSLCALLAGVSLVSAQALATAPEAPQAPSVDSQSVSNVTPFDATLEGLVDPNNQESTYHLEYASSEAALGTAGANTLAYGIVGPGVSGDEIVGPVDLGGVLAPNTTYYYRVVAKNASGETEGTVGHPVESFKTLSAEKPSVSGETLVGATHISDTIEAQLNPEYQGVSCEVQYVSETVFKATGWSENVQVAGCSPVAPATEFGQGDTSVPFTATLGGLAEGTTYVYRVVAANGTGTFTGSDQTLSRVPPRIVGAAMVSEVTQHTALISPAEIDPEIEAPLEASYYVLYGSGEAELASTHASAGSGLTSGPVGSIPLYGLEPGTTYHYALVAYNGHGQATVPQGTFTTAPAAPLTTPPVIGAQTAQFVGEAGAVIEGEVNPEGLATSYEVQYGVSPAYGSSTSGLGTLTPFTSAQSTITSLVGLTPGATYHYRIVAHNQAGSSYGQDATFTTSGAAPTTAFASFTIPIVPVIDVAAATLPGEEPLEKATPKKLTSKKKLANALKACAKKSKKQRAKCEKRARKSNGSAAKTVSAVKTKRGK